MKTLINHLLNNNLNGITERSLLNCHCKGLHSIMLLESPGQTIRLYIANIGNHLYKNAPEFYQDGMSIGFHPHHCNLTLHVRKGKLTNWQIEPAGVDTSDAIYLREYIYHSQITEGKQGFESVSDATPMIVHEPQQLYPGLPLSMPARAIHTVYCNPFEVTAWLVYEGKEDPAYRPVTYSTAHLENVLTEGLYQKPTREQVRNLIALAGLI